MRNAFIRPPTAPFVATSKSEVLNAALDAGMAAALFTFNSMGFTLTDNPADDPDGLAPFNACDAAFTMAFEAVLAHHPDDSVAKSIRATAALTDGFYNGIGDMPPLWRLASNGTHFCPEPARRVRFRMQKYIDPKRPGAPRINPHRATCIAWKGVIKSTRNTPAS